MKKFIAPLLYFFFFAGSMLLPALVKAQSDLKKICYLTVDADKQGRIKGEVTQKGREGQMAGFGYAYSVSVPRETGTGLATGRKVQSGVTITKAVGISSPQLMQALTNNEILKTVTIEFWGPSPSGNGTEIKFYSVKLSNAGISSISQFGGTNTTEKNLKSDMLLEEITFSFQKMEIVSTDGVSTTATTDDGRIIR